MKSLVLLPLVACTAMAQSSVPRRERGIRANGEDIVRKVDRHLKLFPSKSTKISSKGSRAGSSDHPDIPIEGSAGSEGNAGAEDGVEESGCMSTVAQAIANVESSLVLNPTRCCSHNGPTAAIITHAQWDERTPTGFEPFWNSFYDLLDEYSVKLNFCFVMSGYNQTSAEQRNRDLDDVLTQINALVALLPSVPAMMSTDPTNDMQLVNLFRVVADTAGGPSIGVFNSGFAKISQEAVVTGQERLPYIGYTTDDDYGSEAASITRQLLAGSTPVPLCFNGRPDLPFVGQRCASYYSNLLDGDTPSRIFGVTCRADSSVDALVALMVQNNANAVFSHIDCCRPVAEAAVRVREEYNQTIVVGCQDDRDLAPRGSVNFVTTLPIELQAFQVASWVNLPVDVASETPGAGRADDLFPSLMSFMNTAVYNIVMF